MLEVVAAAPVVEVCFERLVFVVVVEVVVEPKHSYYMYCRICK